mmetsp:Transcript_20890/g.45285  ORF Transcript_20890/g.45285 Transcript_20890/m.45285 type:complete len:596 (-) Transcript_20890:808-2595(-)
MDSSDHSEASADSADGMRTSRPATSRTRFGSLKKTASSTSFFTRGKRIPPTLLGVRPVRLRSSTSAIPERFTSDLTSSVQSQPLRDNDEKRGDVAHDVASYPLPCHEVGSRMKAATKSLRKDGKTSELKSYRRMSRKTRNSDPQIKKLSISARGDYSEVQPRDHVQRRAGGKSTPLGYMHLRAAHLMASQTNDSHATVNNSLAVRLLEMTRKDNVCDIEIIGKDNIAVKAPSFLLASHSAVFEEIFYPKDESKQTYAMISQSDPKKVHIEYATLSAINAAIHFFATLELPPVIETETSETNIRTISQLHLFAQLFQIPALSNAAYRAARRLMNKTPSLVCAAFDECNVLLMKAESRRNWGLTMEKQYDDLRSYVLDYLRESLPEAGVIYFSSASIEAMICDQEMDLDEYNMWRILNLWVNRAPGNEDDKIATARSLISHIQLQYIDPIQLKHQIKKCRYVDPKVIEETIKQIYLMLENESPDDKERVIVEGAGDDRINGVYVLADNDIGLKTSDVMYLKEGDDDGDVYSDYGLYPWGETWGISNSAEYFNILYSCKASRWKGHSLRKPPKWGWKCVGGADPGEKSIILSSIFFTP